ncbi:MAG: right-handed parallel beta-helix repeat-containing protein, partial [Gemmobacter sp.]
MNFADVQGVLIENNYIHDFRLSPLSGDHPDMIQFWTTGTTEASTDIIIRNNTLDIGDGNWTQSIFMRNELVDTGKAGAEMFYRNVLIENNTIYNSHLHGITVGETKGLIIRDNSVLHVPDTSIASGGTAPVNVPTIRVSARSESVTITDNVTAAITGGSGQASWTIKNNAFVQSTNPFGVGFYGDVF